LTGGEERKAMNIPTKDIPKTPLHMMMIHISKKPSGARRKP